MAVDEVVQSPREKRYGFGIQGATGTVLDDGSAVTEVDCEPFEINRDVKQLDVNGSHGSRQMHDNDTVIHNKDAMATFTTTMFAKKEELAFWLYAMIQNVTEGTASPWDKTYTFLTSQPDFQADAGAVFTWFERDPVAAKSTKIGDCIIKAMTITLAGDEPIKLSMEWIGIGAGVINSDPDGTWTRTGVDNLFYRTDIDVATVNYGSGAVSHHLQEFEIALSHDVLPVGQDGSGGPATVALANPTHTAKITVVKDADWQTAMANHAAGTPIDVRIGWGNSSPGTDDGDLDFALHGKMQGPTGAEKNHDDPMTGVMNINLSTDGSTEILTVVMADGVDRTF